MFVQNKSQDNESHAIWSFASIKATLFMSCLIASDIFAIEIVNMKVIQYKKTNHDRATVTNHDCRSLWRHYTLPGSWIEDFTAEFWLGDPVTSHDCTWLWKHYTLPENSILNNRNLFSAEIAASTQTRQCGVSRHGDWWQELLASSTTLYQRPTHPPGIKFFLSP